ncbi:MAG: hypothetical protein WC661_15770 [Opitutaceae bacterium]|jgi:hypothetical protein
MKYLWAVLSLVAVFICGSAKAAAPANDDFVDAELISGSNFTITGDITGASLEPYIGPLGLIDADDSYISYWGGAGGHSIWYKWIAPVSGSVTLNITSAFTPILDIYNGAGITTINNLKRPPLAYNAISYVNGTTGTTTFTVIAGNPYYIRVASFTGEANGGVGFFSLVFQEQAEAFSDSLATSTLIYGDSLIITGNNSGASTESGEPSHGGRVASKSVWLQWTAPAHGNTKISLAGSQFDTLLSVYTDSTLPPTISNLHLVAQNDNENFLKKTSAAGFSADQGVTYYIAIDGAFAQSGSIQFALDFTPTAPSVAKLQNQIVLNGNTATFTAVASGTDLLSYQWERAIAGSKFWTPLTDGIVTDPTANDFGVTYGGSTSATLTVATKADQTLPSNNDQFRCVVTDGIGTTTSSSAKTIVTVLDVVNISVRGTTPGGNPINLTTGGNTGDSYYAKGLPAGLTLDPLTGLVTGMVTAGPGSYTVSYWHVTGTVQSIPLTLVIKVNPLDSMISGGFEAILEENLPVPGVPMGKVSLLVNRTTGAFTGTLVCSEAKAYSLKGTLSLNATYDTGTASVTINRKGLLPYRVDITLDSTQALAEDRFSVALHQLDSSYVLVSTLGQSSSGIQLATFTASSPAPWQGYYTLILDDPTSPPTTPPEGTGFATVTVKGDKGLFRLSGKLGDGTTLTATLAPSADGGYRWYGKPYKTGGFFAGWIQFKPIAGIVPPYQIVGATDSELYWQKSPSSAKDRSYRAGFGPIIIAATAHLWTPPADGVPMRTALHLTTTTGQLIPSFSTTNIPLADQPLLPTVVTLNNSQREFTVKTPQANLDKFKMRVNSITGLISAASITLQDGRKITISGVLIQQPGSVNPGDVIGEGLFLIPPTTKGAETVTGRIQFTSP